MTGLVHKTGDCLYTWSCVAFTSLGLRSPNSAQRGTFSLRIIWWYRSWPLTHSKVTSGQTMVVLAEGMPVLDLQSPNLVPKGDLSLRKMWWYWFWPLTPSKVTGGKSKVMLAGNTCIRLRDSTIVLSLLDLRSPNLVARGNFLLRKTWQYQSWPLTPSISNSNFNMRR